MAYVKNPNEDNEDQTSIATRGSDAPAADSSGSSGTTSATAAPQTPSSSGSFVNLQRYLDTNQQQSQDLAGRVGSQIGEKVAGAESAIKNYGDTGDTAIKSGTATYDPNLVSKAISTPEGFNDAEKAQLANLRTGTYGGPADVTSFGTPNEVGSVTEYGNLGKSAGGRQELLRQLPGATQYAKGGISLDQLLLQNSEPARQSLEQSIATTAPVQGEFTTAQQRLAQAIKNAQVTSSQTGQQVTGELTGALGSQQQTITDRLNQQRAQQEQQAQAIRGGLSTGNVQADALAKLGLTPEQLDSLKILQGSAKGYGESGVNLADYFSASSPNALTAENVATQQEQNKYKALAGLAGVNPNFLTGQVGAGANPFAFNAAGANEALNAQVAAGKGRAQAGAANAALVQQQQADAAAQREAFANASDATRNSMALVLAGKALDKFGISPDAAMKYAWNYLSGQAPAPVTDLSSQWMGGTAATELGATTGAAELGAGTGGAFDAWAATQPGIEAAATTGGTAAAGTTAAATEGGAAATGTAAEAGAASSGAGASSASALPAAAPVALAVLVLAVSEILDNGADFGLMQAQSSAQNVTKTIPPNVLKNAYDTAIQKYPAPRGGSMLPYMKAAEALAGQYGLPQQQVFEALQIYNPYAKNWT